MVSLLFFQGSEDHTHCTVYPQNVVIIWNAIHCLFRCQRPHNHNKIAVVILVEILSLGRFLFRQRALEIDCPMVNRIAPHQSPLYWHLVLNMQVQRFPYFWHRAHLPLFVPWSSHLFNYQTTAQLYQRMANAYGIFVVLLGILLAKASLRIAG